MDIDLELVIKRRYVWEQAGAMINPVVMHHGLEKQNFGQLFNSSPVSIVEQELNHITRMADWLLETN